MRARIAIEETRRQTQKPMTTTRLVLAGALLAALAAPGCKRSETEGAGKTEPAAGGDTAAQPGTAAPPGTAAQPGTEPGQTPDTKTDVTLQLNWVPEPEFGGFYAAAHKGLYEQAGLNVSIVAGGAGVPTWNLVATGKVPFAIASADEVIRARLQDAKLVALYAVYQTNPHALMVHASSGVGSLEEIFTSGKIKRVIMEPGLPYGRFLQQKYGFDKVEIVQYGGNLSLFLQDKLAAQQCFVFSEPVSAAEQGVEVKAFSVGESGFNPYLAVVITSEAYLQENPAVVEAFVRASRAGWQAYLDAPGPTHEYMKTQQATMTLSAMQRAAALQQPYIVSDETRASYLGYMSEARWQALADQLVTLGEVAEKPASVSALFRNVPPA
jgi:NitT/TauT family transport system substrate-binding protein